jgi:hypothetical protein
MRYYEILEQWDRMIDETDVPRSFENLLNYLATHRPFDLVDLINETEGLEGMPRIHVLLIGMQYVLDQIRIGGIPSDLLEITNDFTACEAVKAAHLPDLGAWKEMEE